jgi:hypothetical protein
MHCHEVRFEGEKRSEMKAHNSSTDLNPFLTAAEYTLKNLEQLLGGRDSSMIPISMVLFRSTKVFVWLEVYSSK